MKKAMLIETFEAMSKSLKACEKIWEEDGNHDMLIKTREERITLDMVIEMMTDDLYAKQIREIYFKA